MWVIANWNYSEEDLINFNSVANDYGVNCMIIDNKQDLFDYINNKDGNRSDDLITEIAFFAHGTAFDTPTFVNEGHENDYAIALGLAKESNNDLNIFGSDLSKISTNAFSENNITYFGTCRTGAVFNGRIFAQDWANLTLGDVIATAGRTSYYNIYPDDRNLWEKILEKLGLATEKHQASRTIARKEYGFSTNGSPNFPETTKNDVWQCFRPQIGIIQHGISKAKELF